MLRCSPLRSRHRRHRLNTLPIARHHQPSAVIAKRFGPSRMSDDACKTLNICRKSRRYVSRFCQTHLSLPMLKSESSQIYDSCRQRPRHSDSVRLGRDSKHRPISARKLAIGLPAHAWHKITWREGTAERLSSRFARVRVRPAHRDYRLAESRPEEWLLIEWPEGEEAPTKYWLSTLPSNIGFRQFVDMVKLRWRIDRDYHDLKQEIGLSHFEGRGWRGFHHHATLCIAA